LSLIDAGSDARAYATARGGEGGSSFFARGAGGDAFAQASASGLGAVTADAFSFGGGGSADGRADATSHAVTSGAGNIASARTDAIGASGAVAASAETGAGVLKLLSTRAAGIFEVQSEGDSSAAYRRAVATVGGN